MRQYAGARDGCGYGFRPPTTPTHIRLPRQCYHFKSFRIRYQTSDEVGQGLTKEEIEERVGHAINLLRTSHKLLLNDPVTKPMGLVIW